MIYLNEKTITNSSLDCFGHIEIAKEIEEIINSKSKENKSLTIGVFGKWGVGKSSIIELLKEEVLKENKEEVVYIDVPIWKYSDAKSIRRKFIYQIAKKLGVEDAIKKAYLDVQIEVSFTILDKIISSIHNFLKDSFKLLLVIFATLIILLSVSVFFDPRDFARYAFDATLIVTVFTVCVELIKLIRQSKIGITQKAFESEEEFEHAAEEHLSKEDSPKKIIVIDDLDRCDSNKILTVFEVIKNFIDIKNCIFLIACDPQIIKKAIGDKRKALVENGKDSIFYLDKIFQYIVNVPEFLPQNMRDYAENLIVENDIDLFKEEALKIKLGDIAYILMYQDAINPRKAKSLINSFILNYTLALKLEENDKSFLKKGDLTNYPERIAFITVIKSEFPEIIDKLKNLPTTCLNKSIDEIFQNDDSTQKDISICDSLINFFKNNSALFQEDWDISPYIYFNADSSSKLLDGTNIVAIPELSKAIRNGNIDELHNNLDTKEEKVRRLKYTYQQIELINNSVEKKNWLKSLNSFFSIIENNEIPLDFPINQNSKILEISQDGFLINNDKEFVRFISFIVTRDPYNGKDLLGWYVENYVSKKIELLNLLYEDSFFEIFDKHCMEILENAVSFHKSDTKELIKILMSESMNLSIDKFMYFKDFLISIKEDYIRNIDNDLDSALVEDPIHIDELYLNL